MNVLINDIHYHIFKYLDVLIDVPNLRLTSRKFNDIYGFLENIYRRQFRTKFAKCIEAIYPKRCYRQLIKTLDSIIYNNKEVKILIHINKNIYVRYPNLLYPDLIYPDLIYPDYEINSFLNALLILEERNKTKIFYVEPVWIDLYDLYEETLGKADFEVLVIMVNLFGMVEDFIFDLLEIWNENDISYKEWVDYDDPEAIKCIKYLESLNLS